MFGLQLQHLRLRMVTCAHSNDQVFDGEGDQTGGWSAAAFVLLFWQMCELLAAAAALFALGVFAFVWRGWTEGAERNR